MTSHPDNRWFSKRRRRKTIGPHVQDWCEELRSGSVHIYSYPRNLRETPDSARVRVIFKTKIIYSAKTFENFRFLKNVIP